jgi:hypothetical protein
MKPSESPDIPPRSPKPPTAGANAPDAHAPARRAERKPGACAPDQLHICFNCAGELV